MDLKLRRSGRFGIAAAFPALLLAACGGDSSGAADGPAARVARCATPRLASFEGRPFDWVGVDGLPDGFLATAAEITASGSTDTLLARVSLDESGSAALRIPIHPSFERTGGDVSVRIYSGESSCDPVPLAIAALDVAPGAMAEAAGMLRAAMDAIVGGDGSPGATTLRSSLVESPGKLPIFALPALFSVPELEELEQLLDEGLPAEEGEMLDAIAGRLELSKRMAEFAKLVALANELAGDLTIGSAPIRTSSRSAVDGELSVHFASYTPPSPAESIDQCPADQFNLISIADPFKLDALMRVQDYAERFHSGATDANREEGAPARAGTAAGTVFGDIGEVVGTLAMVAPQGRQAAKVWSAFSQIVLNTAEGYSGLLPGDMELSVVASPDLFDEDSEEKGAWRASAVATSKGVRLTKRILQKVAQEALSAGMGDVSVGRSTRHAIGSTISDETLDRISGQEAVFLNEVINRAESAADRQLRTQTSAALKNLLDALGAEEGPDWFDIPPGCWALPDMLAGLGFARQPSGALREALLEKPELEGPAVAWSDPLAPMPSQYELTGVGTSILRVRTIENARQTALEITTLGHVVAVATTYGFGGDQYTASTQIEVRPVDIEIRPEIIAIEPGDPVPFRALVDRALDTRVRWRASAGTFEEAADLSTVEDDDVCPDGAIGPGETRREATLLTAGVPLERYPITVTVESMAACGLLKDAEPPSAEAFVQTGDPVMLITPPRACAAPGDTLQLGAELLGLREGMSREVRWTATGGRVDREGRFVAPRGDGTYEVTVTSVSDNSLSATSTITVGGDCCGFTASVSAGPGAGRRAGPAHLVGRALSLSDVDGDWSVKVEVPSFEPGTYETGMMVSAEIPHPENPNYVVMEPADAPDGEPVAPATLYIDHSEGDLGWRPTGEAVVEGRLVGRAGWRRPPPGPGGDVYFDLDVRFKAVKYAVGPTSPYQACRGGWGLETSSDLLRELEGGN